MTKVSRMTFLEQVAKRSGLSEEDVLKFYDAMMAEMKEMMRQGKRVTLTGFGSFFMAKHKGHPVQFNKDEVHDYVVFKFSSSNVLNKKFREDYKNGLLKVAE